MQAHSAGRRSDGSRDQLPVTVKETDTLPFTLCVSTTYGSPLAGSVGSVTRGWADARVRLLSP